VRLLASVLLVIGLILTGCASATEEPPPEPQALIAESAEKIRETQTFRMEVERTGAEYYVDTGLGSISFRRALAQYVAPDVIQATVRVTGVGLTADVDIFSRGDDQWYRNSILTANQWYNALFAPGFNPRTLIAEDTGFQSALASLIDLEFVGREELEDGTPVYHIKATANGPDVEALLVGLVEAEGEVLVDVFIDRETLYPVRFVIVQPETVSETEPEPTTWTIDVYDINEEPELDDPETAANTVEATAEATPES
jgi:hypothetical protein